MPLVAARVMELVGDERTTPEDLAAVVSTDQALTAKLIRLANSAEYAFARRCANARDAIHLLGFLQVRQFAVTASLMSLFQGPAGTDPDFDADLFWAHSLTVAVACEIVAKSTGASRADEAFTAGILHDIGQLVLRRVAPAKFHEAAALARSEEIPLHEAERKVMGYSHQEIGEALARKWCFPPHLVSAIADHHDATLTVPADGLRGIVSCCDQLVLREGITCGFYGDDSDAVEITPALENVERLAGGMTLVMNRASRLIDEVLGRVDADEAGE